MTHVILPENLDLSALVRAGDTVVWGQGPGEALTLTETLVAQRHSIGNFKAFFGLSLSETLEPAHSDRIEMSSYAGIGTNRALCAAGCLNIVPCHYSQLPDLISCDVVLLHLSPANGAGLHSLGVAHDYLPAITARARVVIAEVNERMPWTFDGGAMNHVRIDYIVPTSRALIDVADPQPDEITNRIAGHVAGLVPDGAVLQIGVGALPGAILHSLRDHRRLGIHTGLIGDGLVDLMECGAVTNETKTVDRGLSVTGLAFGTRRLYDFVNTNPAVAFRPPVITHAGDIAAGLDAFISVNSAIEVDLTGQVNAETAGGKYLGAVGGQVDFVRAARLSANGKSIIALPATASNGTASRIVRVTNSATVTTARSDTDIVVTEFGAAHLRGLTLAERASSLIAIAHPDFREDLARRARDIAGIRTGSLS